MTWKIWQQNEKNTMNPVTLLKEAFQILTTTLLSLLLPLSFLLIARLTTAQYLLDLNSSNTTLYQPFNQLFSIFLYTNPTLLHGLIAIVSVSSLLHALKGNDWIVTRPKESGEPVERSHIYTAWVLLCTLQVVVGLGIEGSIGAGVEGSNFGYEGFVLTRLMFFLGLLDTMLHWSRTVVKPVVDDTVFGSTREERWVERVLMAACLSGLWWWRLKDEVEVLVVAAEVKRELWSGASVGDFVGWWLYYLIVTVGLGKVVKGVVCFGMVVVSKKKIEAKGGESFRNDENV